MDHNFTEQIKQWLETPEAESDYTVKGKRADHDLLSDEIKAKYVENLSLLQCMRELHLHLPSLSRTPTGIHWIVKMMNSRIFAKFVL